MCVCVDAFTCTHSHLSLRSGIFGDIDWQTWNDTTQAQGSKASRSANQSGSETGRKDAWPGWWWNEVVCTHCLWLLKNLQRKQKQVPTHCLDIYLGNLRDGRKKLGWNKGFVYFSSCFINSQGPAVFGAFLCFWVLVWKTAKVVQKLCFYNLGLNISSIHPNWWVRHTHTLTTHTYRALLQNN